MVVPAAHPGLRAEVTGRGPRRAVERGPADDGRPPVFLLVAVTLVTMVVVAPLLWSRASARDVSVTPRPSSVTGAVGDGRLSAATCVRAVTSLLAQDLTRAASGRPDVDVPVDVDAMAALGGPGTPATAQVQQIHDELVGPATSDVINAYRQDASAALAAYQVRIAAACARVATP